MLLNLPELKLKYNLNVTGILHVGAHYGEEYNEYINTFGSDTPIAMWEASKDNFDILHNRLQNNNPYIQQDVPQDIKVSPASLTLIQRGVGSFDCTTTLYKETANNGQSNSVLKPELHTVQYPGIVFNDIEEIKISPLDKWHLSNLFNFLNIDIQGFELQAFLGAKKTLSNIDYIVTEVNRAELYENCATVDEIDWYLSKWNFRRVETSWAGNSWGDAFYVKSKSN